MQARLQAVLGTYNSKDYKAPNSWMTEFDKSRFAKAGAVYNRSEFLDGINYNDYGSRKGGLSSLLDSEVVRDNIAKRANKQSKIRFAQVDADGNAIKGSTMNFGGRLFKSNQLGTFHQLDGDLLREKKQKRIEHENYLNSIIELCADSEEDLSDALDLDVDQLEELLGKNQYGGDNTMPVSLREIDAMPRTIRALPADSKEMRFAIAKIAFWLDKRLPMINYETATASIMNKDKEIQ